MIASAFTDGSWKLSECDDYTETDLLFASWHTSIARARNAAGKTNSCSPITSTYNHNSNKQHLLERAEN